MFDDVIHFYHNTWYIILFFNFESSLLKCFINIRLSFGTGVYIRVILVKMYYVLLKMQLLICKY